MGKPGGLGNRLINENVLLSHGNYVGSCFIETTDLAHYSHYLRNVIITIATYDVLVIEIYITSVTSGVKNCLFNG